MSPPIDNLSDAFTKDICVTDQKAPAREMVGDYLFEFAAGGFFQINNTMVDYLRGLIDSVKDIPLTWLTRSAEPVFSLSLFPRGLKK